MIGKVLFLFLAIVVFLLAPRAVSAETPVLVVVGAGGTEEYQQRFEEAASLIAETIEDDASVTLIGAKQDDRDDRTQIQEWIESQPREGKSPMWLILIGHGTFDGRSAKFNLRGPDVSAKLFSQWLDQHARPLIMVNTSSSSGPFINALSSDNRIVITGTKSGSEENATRFGGYFAKALTSLDSDLDHDDAVSVREAFIKASADVAAFYKNEDRLASEHALLDDNGDGQGTSATLLRKANPIDLASEGKAAARITLLRSPDAVRLTPEQEQRRGELEQQLAKLRQRKESLDDADYFEKLESIVVQLTPLYVDDAR